MQQPEHEGPGLLGLLGGEERRDAERGVARPGEAVVPVACPTDELGQRRRGCGHGRTRGGVGEQPQGDEAAGDDVPVLRWDVQAGRPRGPALLVVVRDGRGPVGRDDDQGTPARRGQRDGELRPRRDRRLDGSVGDHRDAVRGDGHRQVPVLDDECAGAAGGAGGRMPAVSEPGRQLDDDVNRSAPAHQASDEQRAGQESARDVTDKAVGELQFRAVESPGGDQRGRAWPVAPVHGANGLGGPDPEVAAVRAGYETTEERRVVEARDAPPVDRPVRGHEGGAAGVSDEPMVPDRHPAAAALADAGHRCHGVDRNKPSTEPYTT